MVRNFFGIDPLRYVHFVCSNRLECVFVVVILIAVKVGHTESPPFSEKGSRQVPLLFRGRVLETQ